MAGSASCGQRGLTVFCYVVFPQSSGMDVAWKGLSSWQTENLIAFPERILEKWSGVVS